MQQDTHEQTLGQIIAKCWSDASFKARLMSDPVAALQSLGIEVPGGLQLQVLADTEQVRHLVIPVSPPGLSDVQLDALAGGQRLNAQIVDSVTQTNVKQTGDSAAQLANPIYRMTYPWQR
jgi:hypothetical protein